MSTKAETIAKLERLAAPGSGATEGERRNALEAIARLKAGEPEPESDSARIRYIIQEMEKGTEELKTNVEKVRSNIDEFTTGYQQAMKTPTTANGQFWWIRSIF